MNGRCQHGCVLGSCSRCADDALVWALRLGARALGDADEWRLVNPMGHFLPPAPADLEPYLKIAALKAVTT